ncbi:MAG: cytidine deaminase [Clostridia bacterium]|nr:cytidine deaminase [Clostridia bacterium]
MTNDIWTTLYNKAVAVQNPCVISPFIEAGGVGAAILTKSGNIYTGVCIDTASTLGMCAERNAIANMITNGEHNIDKVVAVMPNGKVGSPCGACREFMMQLACDSGEIEVLTDYESRTVVKLKELFPDWWGKERYEQNKNASIIHNDDF